MLVKNSASAYLVVNETSLALAKDAERCVLWEGGASCQGVTNAVASILTRLVDQRADD